MEELKKENEADDKRKRARIKDQKEQHEAAIKIQVEHLDEFRTTKKKITSTNFNTI